MPLASDKSCLNFGLDYVMLFQVFERIPGFYAILKLYILQGALP